MRKREKRPRAHIRADERVAAALAMLLPAEQRDALRAAKAPARAVLKLFQWDHHPILFALGGPDLWWNLVPRQVKEHREKSRGDTRIVAKVDRIIERQAEHQDAMRRILAPRRDPAKPLARPKRKIPSRPFNALAKR